MDELVEVHRARTLVPTVAMTAIAATVIRPAINTYSITSPPRSSTGEDCDALPDHPGNSLHRMI